MKIDYDRYALYVSKFEGTLQEMIDIGLFLRRQTEAISSAQGIPEKMLKETKTDEPGEIERDSKGFLIIPEGWEEITDKDYVLVSDNYVGYCLADRWDKADFFLGNTVKHANDYDYICIRRKMS